MKPITYTQSEWNDIWERIKSDYPPSVYLLRDRMRKKLGFTPREHTYWDTKRMKYKTLIYLDFYDEKYRTMFLLKYSVKPDTTDDAIQVYDC